MRKYRAIIADKRIVDFKAINIYKAMQAAEHHKTQLYKDMKVWIELSVKKRGRFEILAIYNNELDRPAWVLFNRKLNVTNV